MNFTKKADKEQSRIIKETFKEANKSRGKILLKIINNLAHFHPHYLDSNDILKFSKEEWLKNYIVDLFVWVLNNQGIHHWQKNLGT